MRLRHVLAAAAAAVLAAGGTVLVAPSASADTPIIWYQAVGRPSADAPCPTTSSDDATAGWTEWTGSWEEWANDGKGGPVCTRSITWAYEAIGDGGGYPSAGCVLLQTYPYPTAWINFNGGWSLPAFADAWASAPCSGAPFGYTLYDNVYAPNGLSQAVALCQEAFGVSGTNNWSEDVYGCVNAP